MSMSHDGELKSVKMLLICSRTELGEKIEKEDFGSILRKQVKNGLEEVSP